LHARFNIRAYASMLVLMRFFDSPVNDASKIRAGGTPGDWDRLLPIGQFLRRRLSSGSCSTVSDQWSMRWIMLCTSIKWVDLVPIGTESQISQIQCNWSSLSSIEHSINIAYICRCILTQLEWFKLIYNFTIWNDYWNAIESVGTDYDSSRILITHWLTLTLTCLTIFITLT
jgi:hypothetical protein